MGLDACVYCDCVEKGRLKVPPPHAESLYIEPDGSPELNSDDIALGIEFDVWRNSNPCCHEQLCLLHYRLGNMSGIDRIRRIVQHISAQPEQDFFLLWTRVIYSSIHAGDFLTAEEAVSLGAELQRLRSVDVGPYAGKYGDYFGQFLAMLEELVEVSRLVGKPISF